MLKKVFALFISTLLVLGSLTACGPESSSKTSTSTSTSTSTTGNQNSGKKIRIGVTYQNLQGEYIQKLKEFLGPKAKELNVEVLEADGEGKAEKQISQVENFIAQKVDAVICNPFDKDGAAPIVTMCNQAKIPVIILCTKVSNLDQATAFVGSDDKQSGAMAMTAVAEALGGKGNIYIMQGPTGHSAEVSRTEGIKEIAAKYPNIKILGQSPADWDRAKAMNLTENWLQSGKTINAILAENDEMAMGVVKAVEAAGKLDQIKITGCDAIPDAIASVKEGKMLATYFQNARVQAETAVELAVKAVNGEKIEQMNYVPFQLVTKDNADEIAAAAK